jgi:hypothetical protein
VSFHPSAFVFRPFPTPPISPRLTKRQDQRYPSKDIWRDRIPVFLRLSLEMPESFFPLTTRFDFHYWYGDWSKRI